MIIFGFYAGMTVFWLVLTVAFLIIEAITIGLTTIWFAAGSLAAFLLSVFDVPVSIQLMIFISVSVCLLVFTRKIFVEKLKTGYESTNVNALHGEIGQVIMDIEPLKAGQVNVNGQVWSAVSQNNEAITKDQIVKVIAIEGVKLVVTPEVQQ